MDGATLRRRWLLRFVTAPSHVGAVGGSRRRLALGRPFRASVLRFARAAPRRYARAPS
jgi:hypothetical protein